MYDTAYWMKIGNCVWIEYNWQSRSTNNCQMIFLLALLAFSVVIADLAVNYFSVEPMTSLLTSSWRSPIGVLLVFRKNTWRLRMRRWNYRTEVRGLTATHRFEKTGQHELTLILSSQKWQPTDLVAVLVATLQRFISTSIFCHTWPIQDARGDFSSRRPSRCTNR